MIVQTTSDGQPSFVIEQADHARMSGQVAAAFGNDRFAAPVPRDLMIYVAGHHDEGWVPVDGLRLQSPDTGLPYHLTQTPLSYVLRTSAGSPAFNEAHHPFCGVLSSMHTYGLFHGRYGLSDFIFVERVPVEHKAAVMAMLDNELARQERLKRLLAADPASAGWVEEAALFDSYKLLQFFDTLSLYFHLTGREQRGQTSFQHVPDGRGADHTLTIEPVADAYRLSPFPFAGDELTVSVLGRTLTPQPPRTDFGPIFDATPKVAQSYRVVAG